MNGLPLPLSASRAALTAVLWTLPSVAAFADGSAGAGAGERACLRVLRPVAQGQAFVAADLRQDRCLAGETPQRAHYDRAAGLARAPLDLSEGDAVVPFAPNLYADVRQGDRLAFVYRDGAIAISRTGTAARDSKAGAAVQLTTGDGAVVTVPPSTAVSPGKTP